MGGSRGAFNNASRVMRRTMERRLAAVPSTFSTGWADQ